MRRREAAVAAVAAALAALALAAPAPAAVTYDHSFGEAGTGAGQFAKPTGVAVNEATGDIYVVDRDNNRIQRFDHEGNFISMWGRGVNATTNGHLCTAASGNTCKAGSPGGGSGWFNDPRGIAIDNSGGPAAGSVYIQDAGNVRVQRFTADGSFVLTWGKGVNHTTGGRVCTQASGDACTAGEISGDATTTPPVPSADGVFAGWGGYYEYRRDPVLATDGAGNLYIGDGNAVPIPRVQKFGSEGDYLGKLAPKPTGSETQTPVITFITGLAAGANGDVFVNDVGSAFNGSAFKRFSAGDFTQTGETATVDRILGGGSGVERPAVDPENGFVFGLGPPVRCGGTGGRAVLEYHPNGQQVDCTVPTAPAIGTESNGRAGGMVVTSDHRLYVADTASERIHVFETPVATPPAIEGQTADEITSAKAVVTAAVAANLGETTFHIEYGPAPCSEVPSPCASTPESESVGAAYQPAPVSSILTGLEPSTAYYYRVVAENEAGATAGPDQKFTTYRESVLDPSCPNNLARQQTGASLLPECRAYELVSAGDQGGYNVTTDLVPGQTPFGGFPSAPDRALYSVHNGGIPNSGKPTNRGPDPYVATRDAANERWNTQYVGVPVDVPSAAPFSSTLAGAAANLDSFAFAGPEMCDPCFGDGSTGIPIRTPGGAIVQGMAGSLPVAMPEPAGEVIKALSADGTHFLFGSEQRFEAAGNPDDGNVTIYSRDLLGGTTEVVSTLPGGETIAAGDGVAALDVSADGSRVLIGVPVSTDSEGNRYWDLYMHTGDSAGSIAIAGGAGGALYNGMTADGAQVLFATRDGLDSDTDSSLDLYRATISTGATIERVSTGSGSGDTDSCDPAGNSFNPSDWNAVPGGPTDCSVVAVGGGGGVAGASGTAHFLSPELLDGPGNGIEGAPNLYRAGPGASPEFVATLESGATQPLKPGAHPFEGASGTFENGEGVAIDGADGSFYVLDNLDETNAETITGAFVQKFNADGSVDTGFGTGGKIDGTGSPSGKFIMAGWGEGVFGTAYGAPTQIAVDNAPSSPSYGDIYVPDIGNFAIKKFDSEGNYESQIEVGDYITGIAVNPANGDVYATGYFGSAYVWDASGAVKPGAGFGIPAFVITSIAIDGNGRAYVADGTKTRVYEGGAETGTIGAGPAFTVAVDPSDDHLYVNHGDHVSEFDPAGSPLGEFGAGSLDSSIGIAAAGGRAVAANTGAGNAVRFGPPATPPDSRYDSRLAIDSVRENGLRRTADFQVTEDGSYSVFPSTRALTGFDSAGHAELFRHAAGSGEPRLRLLQPDRVARGERQQPRLERPQRHRRRRCLLHHGGAPRPARRQRQEGRLRVERRRGRADLHRAEPVRLRAALGQRRQHRRLLLHPRDAGLQRCQRQPDEALHGAGGGRLLRDSAAAWLRRLRRVPRPEQREARSDAERDADREPRQRSGAHAVQAGLREEEGQVRQEKDQEKEPPARRESTWLRSQGQDPVERRSAQGSRPRWPAPCCCSGFRPAPRRRARRSPNSRSRPRPRRRGVTPT